MRERIGGNLHCGVHFTIRPCRVANYCGKRRNFKYHSIPGAHPNSVLHGRTQKSEFLRGNNRANSDRHRRPGRFHLFHPGHRANVPTRFDRARDRLLVAHHLLRYRPSDRFHLWLDKKQRLGHPQRMDRSNSFATPTRLRHLPRSNERKSLGATPCLLPLIQAWLGQAPLTLSLFSLGVL